MSTRAQRALEAIDRGTVDLQVVKERKVSSLAAADFKSTEVREARRIAFAAIESGNHRVVETLRWFIGHDVMDELILEYHARRATDPSWFSELEEPCDT